MQRIRWSWLVLILVAGCGDHSSGAHDLSMAGCAHSICGGQCIDLDRDPMSCGSCGHVCGCGSTGCTEGVCDAVTLAPAQGGPNILTAADGQLYWGNDTDRTLSTVPAAGGTAKVIFPQRTKVRGIAVLGSDIYFTRFDFNVIEHGTITGGGGGNYTNTREPNAYGIATDATHVYWADDNDGPSMIQTVAIAQPHAVSTLHQATGHFTALAIDSANIYWLVADANGTVMKMAKTGGTPVPLASHQATPADLAIDAQFAYWTNSGDGTVNRVALGGGTVTPLASGRKDPRGIKVDANFVYYADIGAGTVEKVALAGGTPIPLAIHQNQPLGLAIDDQCVYFTENAAQAAGAGSVRRAPK